MTDGRQDGTADAEVTARDVTEGDPQTGTAVPEPDGADEMAGDGNDEPDTDPAGEDASEPDEQPVPDETSPEFEVEPEPVSEPEPEAEPEAEAEAAPEPTPEPGAAPAPEPGGAGDGADRWVPQPWDAPTEVMASISADHADWTDPTPAPGLPGAAPVRVPTSLNRLEPATADADADADASEPDRSPMDVFPVQERRRRWPKVLGVAATVLVLLAGAYVGALWLWSDRVPPGVTVAGVEIGGLSADEAVTLLDDTLAAATAEPIPVVTGDKRTELDPVATGLRLDAETTVSSVTGFDLQPIRLWHHLFGTGAIDPVTDVDDAALEAGISEVAASLVTPPVDGTVVFVDGQAEGTDAVEGLAVDEEAARTLLVDGWLTAPRPIELPTAVIAPTITQAEVERVLDELARPLVRAPVSVAVAGQIAELPPDVLAAAASFVPDGDALALKLDGAQLVEAVMVRTTNLLTEPSDASFAFQDGAPIIVPGVPGTTLDPEALSTAVAAAGTGTDRTATVELVQTDPAQSTAALEALGVTQVVAEFDTPLTSEPRRTANIINGASKISGILVRPDEVFSLTEALGPLDAAHGFVQAGAIVSGEHTDAWGGGLSQISTTTYNAAFFAGFEDVEHTSHSEWFARYPEGREATIFTGVIDLKWRNNTPYGALIQSWVEAGRVHVRIWSTPYWTVEQSTSGRSGVTPPTTVYSQSPTCEPQRAGNPGFRVTVTRRVLLDGVEHINESWNVRYRAQNTVVCGPAPAG